MQEEEEREDNGGKIMTPIINLGWVLVACVINQSGDEIILIAKCVSEILCPVKLARQLCAFICAPQCLRYE